jgi:hypothetical protein
MSRQADLENAIRESYTIIRDYEAIIRTSERPEEKLRAQRIIEKQWEIIRSYLAEYEKIAVGSSAPNDISEISKRFSNYESRINETTSSHTVSGGITIIVNHDMNISGDVVGRDSITSK